MGEQIRSALKEALAAPLSVDAALPPDARADGTGTEGQPPATARSDPLLLHKAKLEHFAAALGVEDTTFYERAFALADTRGTGRVSLEDFESMFHRVFHDMQALKSALNGNASSVSALTFIANVIVAFVFLIAVFVIFDVSLAAVIVPMGTLFVSLSFAVGPSVANLVMSLTFSFERRFDVGDRVTIRGAHVDGGELYTVQRIDVLSTTFLTFTNRLTIIPNYVLAASVIENLKRSPAANVRLDLAVSTATSAKQLERLQERLRRFTESESSAFKPGVFFRIRGIADGLMLLSVWGQSHYSYGCVPQIYRGIFSFWLATLEAARAENIVCQVADQTVHVDFAQGGGYAFEEVKELAGGKTSGRGNAAPT